MRFRFIHAATLLFIAVAPGRAVAHTDWSDVDVAFTITSYGIALVGGWLITSGLRDLHEAIWWHNRQFVATPE